MLGPPIPNTMPVTWDPQLRWRCPITYAHLHPLTLAFLRKPPCLRTTNTTMTNLNGDTLMGWVMSLIEIVNSAYIDDDDCLIWSNLSCDIAQ
jgi:hypothetical protein